MAISREHILALLAQNLENRGSVMPVRQKLLTRWADGLGLPKGGKTILYTGHMYQIMPFIRAMAAKNKKMDGSWLEKYAGFATVVNRIVNIVNLLSMGASSDDIQFYNDILRNIVTILGRHGIKPGYLYEDELYAGALAYDLGLDSVFERHARAVHDLLRRCGAELIITVDPHTTQMFRLVYPEVLDNFDIKVKSYLEVLAGSEREIKGEEPERSIVVHDSCVYSRYLDMVDEPRRLLAGKGFKIVEPLFSGRLTHCCGGPVESLFPEKAREIAEKRLESLPEGTKDVATMCPICLFNLKEAAEERVHTADIASYLL